jgi:hypothetical protein
MSSSKLIIFCAMHSGNSTPRTLPGHSNKLQSQHKNCTPIAASEQTSKQ